ncbi:hypothetical protein Ancab_034045 [Ancistrocladus abbreviatus]
MKSAIVERELGNTEEERRLPDEGLKRFPSFFKLWLMLGELEEQLGQLEQAKKVYESGLHHCPHRIPLGLSLANHEEKTNGVEKKEADNWMAKALRECPTTGILCAASIEMVPHPQRKEKSMDVLKKCDHDSCVIAAVTKFFRHDRKHGNEDSQKDVLKSCAAAEPKHGEKWLAVSKAVENSHQTTKAILKKVVVSLGKEEGASENGKQ